jgi:2-iminobutanoate/2-iminopropanoate deaminase
VERKVANPWKWQDALDFVQANEVAGVQRMVFCAGQFSGDTDGRPMYPGYMHAR